MILLCTSGFCGMLPKTGAAVAGLYMIAVTNMYLIFEIGHRSLSLKLSESAAKKHGSAIPKWSITYCYDTAISLAIITYPICIYYLYSVYMRNAMGMVIYIAWIIFYDLANIVILLLSSRFALDAGFSISPLEWFGLVARILTDCFWLSFTVIYSMLIIESKSTGRMSQRIRRISRHASGPPKFRLGISGRRIQ